MDEHIRVFLQNYFTHLNVHDGDGIQKDWHPQGVLFINGEHRPLSFLQELPSVVRFQMQEVERIDVNGPTAAAVISWTMNMPGSTGHHNSLFGLVRHGEGWCIVSQVDHGTEEDNEG